MAQAAPADATALEIYEKGEYLVAAQAAAREGGATGFARGPRDASPTRPCANSRAMLREAEEFARAAIAADANYAESIELAAALGLSGAADACFARVLIASANRQRRRRYGAADA